MSSCLGLYIENNIIKYAKVSKDHDTLKVESFGVKFYQKLGEAIYQVIEETYSQKKCIIIIKCMRYLQKVIYKKQ